MKRLSLTALALVLAMSGAFAKGVGVAVFIPGVVAGSPVYEGLVNGVRKALAESPGSSLKVLEAGFNQAEWEEKLTSLVASADFDVVVSSNPSLPDLMDRVSASFPKQKFICLDAQGSGNPNVHTVLYNQLEQGYVTGYLAGLVSMGGTPGAMPGANAERKAGLVIGQHYPTMDNLIAPGFEKGLKAADPSFQLDTRVLGNWFDATKASELAKSMFSSGVDVILPICGSASQGVLKAAQDAGKYVVFFDGDEFARAPGTVVGCTVLRQEELAYTRLKAAIEGRLAYGTSDVVGMKEGYIEFLSASPAYVKAVPAAIRAKVDAVVARIKSGALKFPVPKL